MPVFLFFSSIALPQIFNRKGIFFGSSGYSVNILQDFIERLQAGMTDLVLCSFAAG